MTVRKAIEGLMQKGLLERQVNGRLTIRKDLADKTLTIAFLVPSTASGNVERWRLGIETVANDIDARVRTIFYVHWDDPMLIETLENFDVVFLFPSGEEMPPRIVKRLKEAGKSLVFLERDLTEQNITSICLFPPFFTQRLLDKLGELGHQSVDCFNIQTVDPVIASRIEQWQLWRAAHRFGGVLYGEPVKPYTPYEAQLTWAYANMEKIIATQKIHATAIFCTTALGAIGAMRAMRDRGMVVGKDFSICTINDEGLARYLSPSLTCIEMPDPTPYIRMCIERIQTPQAAWSGSQLIQPTQPQIFIGESTSPAAKPAALRNTMSGVGL